MKRKNCPLPIWKPEWFGWSQAAALALMAICLLFPWLVKPYVDTFALGLSNAKVYAFGIYVALLAFAKPIIGMAFCRGSPLQKYAGLPGKIDGRLLSALIILIYLYGLAGYLYFVSAVGGEIDTIYRVYDTTGHTFNYINHIHALKTVFCPFGPPSEEFDCARPMLPYLPDFYPYLGIVFALAAALAALFFYPKLQETPEKVAYALISFTALKNGLDGGIFYYENLALFMLIPFLLARKSRLAWMSAGLAIWFILTLVVPNGFTINKSDSPLEYAKPMILVFYSLIITSIRPWLFFPFLVFALLAPQLQIYDSALVEHRWSPEPCANAGEEPMFSQYVWARLYTPCQVEKEFRCGTVFANQTEITYRGNYVGAPALLMAKALSENCPHGAFSIKRMEHSGIVLKRSVGQ